MTKTPFEHLKAEFRIIRANGWIGGKNGKNSIQIIYDILIDSRNRGFLVL